MSDVRFLTVVSLGLLGEKREKRGDAINQSNLPFFFFFTRIFSFATATNQQHTHNGWGSQVSSLPGNFHSSSTCRSTYAFPYVHDTNLPHFPHQTPHTPTRSSPPHTSAISNQFLLPTDTGDRPYKCQHCGDQFARRSVYPL